MVRHRFDRRARRAPGRFRPGCRPLTPDLMRRAVLETFVPSRQAINNDARISHRIECIGRRISEKCCATTISRRIAERPDADRVYSGFVWI